MADISEEKNETIITKYFGTKDVAGIDLVLTHKLFSNDISGKEFLKHTNAVLKLHDANNKKPLWAVNDQNIIFYIKILFKK